MSNAYPYDINASLDSNQIKNEVHTFPSTGTRGFSMLAIKKAPFHKKTFKLTKTDGTPLVENVDFEYGWYYEGLSSKENAPEIYMVIVLKNLSLVAARVLATYHTVGAEFVMENDAWQAYARSATINPTESIWDTLDNRPGLYSTDPNLVPISEAVGWDKFIETVGTLAEESTLTYNTIKTMIDMHANNEVNAHAIDLDLLGISRLRGLKKASLKTLEEGIDNVQYLGVVEVREYLDKYYLSKMGFSTINLKGPKEAYQNNDVLWTISDYDSFSNYEVQSDFMDVSVEGNVIRGKVNDSALVGVNSFSVLKDGVSREINFEVLGNGVVQPNIIGIMDNETNVSVKAKFNISPFTTVPLNADTYNSSQYEISLTESFSSVVKSSTVTNVNNITVDLEEKTRYFIRARHMGDRLVSGWSQPIRFITGDAVLEGPLLKSLDLSDLTPPNPHERYRYYFENYQLPTGLANGDLIKVFYQTRYYVSNPNGTFDWEGSPIVGQVEIPFDGNRTLPTQFINDPLESGLYQVIRVKLNINGRDTLWSNVVTVKSTFSPPDMQKIYSHSKNSYWIENNEKIMAINNTFIPTIEPWRDYNPFIEFELTTFREETMTQELVNLTLDELESNDYGFLTEIGDREVSRIEVRGRPLFVWQGSVNRNAPWTDKVSIDNPLYDPEYIRTPTIQQGYYTTTFSDGIRKKTEPTIKWSPNLILEHENYELVVYENDSQVQKIAKSQLLALEDGVVDYFKLNYTLDNFGGPTEISLTFKFKVIEEDGEVRYSKASLLNHWSMELEER